MARLVPPSVFLEVAVAGYTGYCMSVVATNGFLQVTQFYSAMKSLCYVAIEKFVSGVKKF